MNPASQEWISFKEISVIIGRSYRSVRASASYLGINAYRVQVNRRVILFRRKPTLETLKMKGLL